MKKLFMIVFTLVFVLHLSDLSLYAQGQSRGRSAQAGRPERVERPARPERPERLAKPERSERPERPEKAERPEKSREGRDRDNKVAERFERNPEVAARIEKLIPADTTLASASSGFKNRGQFVAALHVAKNLNIPFDQLKAKMTGNDSMSLGKAVQELRPETREDRAKMEAKKAEKQAKETEKPKTTT